MTPVLNFMSTAITSDEPTDTYMEADTPSSATGMRLRSAGTVNQTTTPASATPPATATVNVEPAAPARAPQLDQLMYRYHIDVIMSEWKEERETVRKNIEKYKAHRQSFVAELHKHISKTILTKLRLLGDEYTQAVTDYNVTAVLACMRKVSMDINDLSANREFQKFQNIKQGTLTYEQFRLEFETQWRSCIEFGCELPDLAVIAFWIQAVNHEECIKVLENYAMNTARYKTARALIDECDSWVKAQRTFQFNMKSVLGSTQGVSSSQNQPRAPAELSGVVTAHKSNVRQQNQAAAVTTPAAGTTLPPGCQRCGKQDHDHHTCPKARSSVTCYHCGNESHLISYCKRKLKGLPKSENAPQRKANKKKNQSDKAQDKESEDKNLLSLLTQLDSKLEPVSIITHNMVKLVTNQEQLQILSASVDTRPAPAAPLPLMEGHSFVAVKEKMISDEIKLPRPTSESTSNEPKTASMFPNIDIVNWAKFGTNSVVGSGSLIFQKSFLPTVTKLPPVQVIALRLAKGLLDPLLSLSACAGGALNVYFFTWPDSL